MAGMSKAIQDTFLPHPWMFQGDLQTLAVELWPRPDRRSTVWWREREQMKLPLGDGDHLLGWMHPQRALSPAETPLVIHAHGLGSHAEAPLMHGVSFKAHAAGFHSLRLNWRGAGGSEFWGTRFTTGLSHHDVAAVVSACRDRGYRRIYWSAVSLGAAVVLNALARGPELPEVQGAVCLSPPLTFGLVTRSLATPRNRVYDMHFVARLKALLRLYVRQGKDGDRYLPYLESLSRVRTVLDFDEWITGPVAGYRDADAYYEAASPGPHLAQIRVPTRIIVAADDPFIPLEGQMPHLEKLPSDGVVSWTVTRYGGHVAFHGVRPPRSFPWEDAWWGENEIIRTIRAWELDPGPG